MRYELVATVDCSVHREYVSKNWCIVVLEEEKTLKNLCEPNTDTPDNFFQTSQTAG